MSQARNSLCVVSLVGVLSLACPTGTSNQPEGCKAHQVDEELPVPGAVKNVILMIGDGMGPNQLELTKFVTDTKVLAMETLDPSPAMMATCSLDGVTDSAAAATAIATGHKTKNWLVGMLPDGSTPETILERAEAIGKSTGLVTDVTVYDATLAAFAARGSNRYSEQELTDQIAAHEIEVLFGGGHSMWIPMAADGSGRDDTRDLIQEKRDSGWAFVDNRDDLLALPKGTDKVIGLFSPVEMTYTLDMEEEKATGIEPSLSDMTNAALGMLSSNDKGFFLLVEGAMIDWGGHSHDAAFLVSELVEFDAAVEIAKTYVDSHPDTLLIVTADHECCGLEFTGKEDKVAIMRQSATGEWIWNQITAGAHLAETMAAHGNLSGLTEEEEKLIRENEYVGVGDVLSRHQNVVWAEFGSSEEYDHTGVDVQVFAYGPGAAAFDGAFDNTELGVKLFYAVSGSAPNRGVQRQPDKTVVP
jgi:alkaline phosphatase